MYITAHFCTTPTYLFGYPLILHTEGPNTTSENVLARDSDTDMVPDKSRQASDKIDKRGDLSHRVTFKLAFFPAKGFNMWVVGIGRKGEAEGVVKLEGERDRLKSF